ncbi:FAD-dependent oxidoreductase [Fusobacterium varium]|uniref:FAD-dependent oxidoreductase n=1 Tax=Fusobacterium varium TaxID=856 RepID=UPI001F438A91|nr:FAD-dependent oxidoreductase [Fusobacterium varium]MCF0169351.1 FAD-dependent oxidoreductase [Fusobacterium varium]MCF2673677.1 FAD-dependent oxidoreductase [Fusobacterium varium]
MKNYDAIVIGFGKGGKTLAGEMANHGWKVAVVEKSDKMYGGTCINVGCIPTKYLIIEAGKNKFKKLNSIEEYAEVYRNTIEKKNELISLFRKKNYDNLNDRENIDIYTGEGSFVNEKVIEIKLKDEIIQIKGEKIFINTGAETVIPPIKGLKENKYVYDSEAIMQLKELPNKLVIIGGGYIGLEYADMYNNFGSEVIVLEGSPLFIPREDREIADEIQKVMERKGIKFVLGAKVTEVQENKVRYEKDGEIKTIDGDAILVAVGRKPNIEGLKLENAGIKTTERGAVLVDDNLHTSVDKIWAMGDVHGGLQFTYTSLDDYRIIRSELFGDKKYSLKERGPVPYTVFIEPQFSRVGMTEEEAVQKGYKVKTSKMPAANPRMKISGETDGLLKAVVDAETGKILGASLFFAQSGEVINNIRLAMIADKDYTFLRDGIFTHPTMSETLNDLFGQIK